MLAPLLLAVTAMGFIAQTAAEDIYILVGAPNSTNVYEPNSVAAEIGDVIIFQFLGGNHSATQSTFYAPCKPSHQSDPTINGFDSGMRYTPSNQSITTLVVPIGPEHINITTWFYDAAPGACGWDESAVGGINLREGSNETIAGYNRNAFRLFGDEAFETTSSRTRTVGPMSTQNSDNSGAAYRAIANQLVVPLSLAFAGAALTLF